MKLRSLLLLLAVSVSLQAQIGDATWATPVHKDFSEPAWLDHGIVFVGNWEPLVFRRRHGSNLPVDLKQQYLREHTEATVVALKRAGVNMILTHFYKTGLQSEADDVELAKKLGVLCHKHGMKLGTYIGGTMFAETLLRDVPEAKNWVRYDEHGEPVRYGSQTYRYRPDFNHPGYVDYMKRVIRVAVEDVKTDLIHFDNFALMAPPATGNTPEINRRFRVFLTGKYSPEQLKQRLGFSDVSVVTVPTWDGIARPSAIAPIGDPLIEEWIDFRCWDMADYYNKLADYIRQLNPKVIVEINPHGIFGTNRAFLNAIHHARLVPHGSVFWSEEPNEAQVTSEGILISKIRSFKLARRLGQMMFSYTGPQRANPATHSYRLLMAEAMAFNRNCLGDVGSPLSGPLLPEDAKRYIRFYRDHNELFSSAKVVADIAVLRSFPSLAYNSIGPHLETTLLEQLLIQYKIPFTYVFDSDLGDLSRFRAVILADQESLSDKAVDQLREYVRNGGGLVATGHTSLYNDWRRRRADYGLADVLGVHWANGRGIANQFLYYRSPSQTPPAEKRGRFGQGCTAYVAAVLPAHPIPDISRMGASGFRHDYWRLPKNSDQLIAAIRYAVGAPFSVEFGAAPLTTVMELTDKRDGSRRLLHWVNYQLGAPAAGTPVTVVVPEGKRVDGVELFSPDRGATSLKFTAAHGRVRFSLPPLKVYEIAVLRFSDR